MLSAAALYLFLVLDISGHLVPVAVITLSLRRVRLSQGFNRWIYAYVAIFSAGALWLLASVGWSSVVIHLAALTLAWATLPLWLCLRVALRPTRSRPSPHIPSASAPIAAPSPGPVPFFTTWRMAARALQG